VGSRRGLPAVWTQIVREEELGVWERWVVPRRWVRREFEAPMKGGIVSVGMYYITAYFGGQPVRVQVDTGSSDVAVPMKTCHSCRNGDKRFDPSASKTGLYQEIMCNDALCRRDVCDRLPADTCPACDADSGACCYTDAQHADPGCAFLLRYADGSGAEGSLVRDVVNFTENGVGAVALFGGIFHDSSNFEFPQVDGILGMAYKALTCTPTCIEPVFDALVREGKVEDTFTLCMAYEGGVLTLGEWDPAVFTSDIQWGALSFSAEPMYYTFELGGGMEVDGKFVSLPSFRVAIMDSGTTLMTLTRETFTALSAEVKKVCNGSPICDEDWFRPSICMKATLEEISTLPTLAFYVGGQSGARLELRPSDYLIEKTYQDMKTYCVGFMIADSMSGIDSVVGNTAQIRYATIYDRRTSRLGIAESTTDCKPASGSNVPNSAPPAAPEQELPEPTPVAPIPSFEPAPTQDPGANPFAAAPPTTQCSDTSRCESCAARADCAWSYTAHHCRDLAELNAVAANVPFPYCHGRTCACKEEKYVARGAMIVAAVAAGILLIVGMALGASVYRRRQARIRAEEVMRALEEEEEGSVREPMVGEMD